MGRIGHHLRVIPGRQIAVDDGLGCRWRVASVPGLPRYAFTLRFNFAGEGTFEIGEGLGANVT